MPSYGMSCPVYLGYLYIVSLILHAYFYIRGYAFKFVHPLSNSREDRLQCVQQNKRAWVQHTTHRFESSKAREKRAMRYQEALAWYIADPSVLMGARSMRRRVTWARFSSPLCTTITLLFYNTSPHKEYAENFTQK
jgi:hypothetical protein